MHRQCSPLLHRIHADGFPSITSVQTILKFFKFVKFLFRYIAHYSQWLPPNHYYICDVELTLTQAIGSGDPRNLQLISDGQLQKKIDLCHKLLKLFNILAAGEILSFCFNHFS